VRTPNNLPAELTSFVGREPQLAELRRLSRRSRLITLTGPGGSGKTRLALRLAAGLLDRYPDGVWLVELSSVTDARLLDQTVASACGIREEAERPVGDVIATTLAPLRTIVILDSTEHIVEESATLANRLLRSCPNLTLLVTSREPLGVPGELIWRTPSLSLPRPEDAGHPELLLQSEAIRLFLDRTRLIRSGFELDRSTAATVFEICARLEGIPLAIELAAGLTGMLTMRDILDGLSDRFRLLTGGSRSSLPRHQTLRQAVDWSYRLLSEPEQALLTRLAAFAGGFSLAAVQAVAEGPLAPEDVMPLLQRLVAKSLVIADPGGAHHTRYQMLETIREYAVDRLQERGDADLRRRHASYFAQWGAEATGLLGSPEQDVWLTALDAEQANIRLALEWTVAEDPENALRLASAMGVYWYMRRVRVEGIEWLSRTLTASPVGSVARARALLARARLEYRQGLEAAWEDAQESVALSRDLGLHMELTGALTVLGLVSSSIGDWMAAERFHTEAMEVARSTGQAKRVAVSQNNLGLVHLGRGEPARARAFLNEALTGIESTGDRYITAELFETIGRVELRLGQLDAARARFGDSLRLASNFDDASTIVNGCEGFALLAMAERDPKRALTLIAAATNLRLKYGSDVMPEFREELQDALVRARTQVSERIAEEAWAKGTSLTLTTVVEFASGSDRRPDKNGDAPLTDREMQVARLIAGGLTNGEVAQQLRISERTVDAHLEHIRNKLGLRTRAQIAVWAHERVGTA